MREEEGEGAGEETRDGIMGGLIGYSGPLWVHVPDWLVPESCG